jgi:hypothetical protein
MINIDEHHPADSRASLVPLCDPDRIPVAQARRYLKWIPQGTPLAIGHIKTNGGFYVQETDGFQFSFAINALLPVGRAENAFPRPLHSAAPVNYSDLDPNERALLLQILAAGKDAPEMSGGCCARLLVQMLEWRLFGDRHQPGEVALAAADLAGHLDASSRTTLLKIMAWSAFFQGRDFHLAAVLEILLEQSFPFLDAGPLHLALFDCATANRAVWPALGLAVECLSGLGFDRWGNPNFQQRFLDQFRAAYPDGIPVQLGSKSNLVEYRPQCPELRKARCRFTIPDVLQEGALGTALGRLARKQFPSRIFSSIEAQEHQPERPQTVSSPPETPQGKLNHDGDDAPEIGDPETAKDFILEHAPLVVPLRFLLGRSNRQPQRIEVMAAEFMFVDTQWYAKLAPCKMGLLQKCFGLTIEQHRGGYCYRVKKWSWFLAPTSQRAIIRLEALWQDEHDVRLDLEHTRQALRAIYKQRRIEQPLPAHAVSSLALKIRDLCGRCDSLERRFRAIIIQQAGLIERLTSPRDFPTEIEVDYRQAPEDAFVGRMEEIAAQFFVPVYIEQRVKCAERIFGQTLDYFCAEYQSRTGEQPPAADLNADLVQRLLIRARLGNDGVASTLLYENPPPEWSEVPSEP